MKEKPVKVRVTCKWKHRFPPYVFVYDFKTYTEEAAEFMFFEGNYSCDCNLSLFIRRYCDPYFPELDCGEEIEITNFEFIND